MKLVDGSYELVGGVRLPTCDEYKYVLKSYAIDGFYHKYGSTTEKMYCVFDVTEFGSSEAHQILLLRKDGSLNFTGRTYTEM